MLNYDFPEWEVIKKVTEYLLVCKGFSFDYLILNCALYSI